MLKFEKFDRSPFQQELVRVFEEAFPPAERPPLRAFLPCTRKPGCVLYAVSEGDTFVGLVCLAGCGDLLCLMYLAVSPRLRGRRYGSRILRGLCRHFKDKRIVLILENLRRDCDNYQQRLARRLFYRHAGFELLPWTVREFGVWYDAMSFGGGVSRQEYIALNRQFYGRPAYTMLQIM